MSGTIKVALVDDSAVVRQVLGQRLAQARDVEVLFTAADPLLARQRMATAWPDVIVLDVEMPKMDGITFLRQIMAERPTPVVICSTLTMQGAATTLEALAAGAVSFVTKPTLGLKEFLQQGAEELLRQIRAAAASRPRAGAPAQSATSAAPAPALAVPQARAMAETSERIVAIGTSTGGTQALEAVLSALPRMCPAIAIVQHMPEKFTELFAQRLDQICEMEVREAANNDRLIPGRVLIAPGGRHMRIKRSGAYWHAEVFDAPPVNRHRPSVDVLFRSVAECAGANALGIIMTGMGDDGARGMKRMLEAGAHCIAQDEATCVVFGMPMEAIKLGAVHEVMPLDRIAPSILRHAASRDLKTARSA
jgi:two-component system chemotaxis response regulator CheB